MVKKSMNTESREILKLKLKCKRNKQRKQKPHTQTHTPKEKKNNNKNKCWERQEPSDSLDQCHRVIQHLKRKLKITKPSSSYWFIVKPIKDFIHRTSELFFNNRNFCLRWKRRNLILNIKRRIITHYKKQRQTAASICYEFKRNDGKYKTCSHFNKLIDIIIAR